MPVTKTSVAVLAAPDPLRAVRRNTIARSAFLRDGAALAA